MYCGNTSARSGKWSAISCCNVRARDAGQRGATLEGRADKEYPEELKVESRGKVLAQSASSVFLSVKVRVALWGTGLLARCLWYNESTIAGQDFRGRTGSPVDGPRCVGLTKQGHRVEEAEKNWQRAKGRRGRGRVEV